MNLFHIEATFPPSLASNPWLGASVIMALLITVLLCGRWIYEIVDVNRSEPAPRGSYIAVARRVRFWLVMAAMLAAFPRLTQLMLWRWLDAPGREAMSTGAWVSTIACAAFIIYAWTLDKPVVAVERDYARQYGYFPVKPVSKQEKLKMAAVLIVVVSMSLATTFVRPAPDADFRSPPATSR